MVHAAGVLSDGNIMFQTRGKYAVVMLPKFYGGWHLHRATQEANFTDSYVLFSSVAGFLGSPG